LVPYSEAVGSDGLLRFSLHQLKGDQYGTVSGRFSSSKPEGSRRGANIQQVMGVEKQKQHGDAYVIRELFIPEPGKLLYSADMSQVEYRIFASMANSKAILDVYTADPLADFHQVVCDMVQCYKPGFSRKSAKGLNFTILFGGGAAKTAEVLGVDEATGEVMREAYFKAFPEARRLMKLAMDTAAKRGYVRTSSGRRCRFPNAQRTHKALNAAIQGTAADVNKQKLVELYAERKRLGLTLRLTVHDEIVGDLPDVAAAADVTDVLNRQTTASRVPLLWSSTTGPNWAACK
jgi:DNA polymerase-1